jgi:hypothetical protein
MFSDPVLTDKSGVKALRSLDPDTACQHVSIGPLSHDCSVAGSCLPLLYQTAQPHVRATAMPTGAGSPSPEIRARGTDSYQSTCWVIGLVQHLLHGFVRIIHPSDEHNGDEHKRRCQDARCKRPLCGAVRSTLLCRSCAAVDGLPVVRGVAEDRLDNVFMLIPDDASARTASSASRWVSTNALH